ncbi:MAG: hypothetical protein KF795_32685 [Labilithrix sp.]|nr:hypothetical protein [Labilithrix sp.]
MPSTTLSAGQTKTVDFPATLTSVTTGTINAAMTLPVGYTKGSILAEMRLPGSQANLYVNQSIEPGALSFSVPVPVMTGAAYSLSLRGTGPNSGEQTIVRTGVDLGATATVTLPAAPALSSPDDAATDVDGNTVFTWSSAAGLSIRSYSPKDDANYGKPGYPSVFVVGVSQTGKLPDLSAVGASISPLASYEWLVLTKANITSIDDFLKEPRVDIFCTGQQNFGGDDGACAYSVSREFVTK